MAFALYVPVFCVHTLLWCRIESTEEAELFVRSGVAEAMMENSRGPNLGVVRRQMKT